MSIASTGVLSIARSVCDSIAMGEEDRIGTLIDVGATRHLILHDEWSGYNEHSPICAEYELRRGARGGLAGEGRLSTRLAGDRVVKVAIPSGAAVRFLDALADARVVEGPYAPRQEWTDDYPHIELALRVGSTGKPGARGGIALLFTESQGEFNAPWGACIEGQLWTLPGEEVGRALAALRGPLKRATLDRMARGG